MSEAWPNRQAEAACRKQGAGRAGLDGPANAARRFLGGRCGRGGAAAAEFAIILPVLLAVVMGIVEFAWMYHVENEMAYVARGVTRDVSVGTYTTAQATAEVTDRLSHFGYPFTVNVNEVANDVTIEVSVPMASAALLNIMGIFSAGSIDTSVTMRKEP